MRPDLIIGFGSYHSFPMMLAAWLFRKKYILFESNANIGKVNRLFAKNAKAFAMQFQPQDYKHDNLILVSMLPWIQREQLQKRKGFKDLGLKENVFTLLVFGGSLGSFFLNDLMIRIVNKKSDNFQVIHICGTEAEKQKLRTAYEGKNCSFYVSAYERDMDALYSLADLCICRSGASTISELFYHLVPSILVPYPFASENHQAKNAHFMEREVKGSCIFYEENFQFEDFCKTLFELLEKKEAYKKLKDGLLSYKEQYEKEKRTSLHDCIHNIIFS